MSFGIFLSDTRNHAAIAGFLLVIAFIFLLYALGQLNDPRFWWQWLGVAITVAVVSLLPLRRNDVVRLPQRDRRLEPAPASA